MQFVKFPLGLLAVTLALSGSAFAFGYSPENDACLKAAEEQAQKDAAEGAKAPGNNGDLSRLIAFSAYYYGKTPTYNPHDYAEPMTDGKHIIEVAADCSPGWYQGCHGYAFQYKVVSYTAGGLFSEETCAVESL